MDGDETILDFFHVSEYGGRAASAFYLKHPELREAWLEDRLYQLKHIAGVVKELIEKCDTSSMASLREEVEVSIRYLPPPHLLLKLQNWCVRAWVMRSP